MAGGKGQEPLSSLEHIVRDSQRKSAQVSEYSVNSQRWKDGNMKTDLEEIFEIESGHGASEALLRHNRVLCYKTRTIRMGEAVEVEAYPVYSRAYPDAARMKERVKSSRAQQRLNDKRAELHFRRKAEANFGRNDYFLTLTYSGAAPSMEQAQRDFRNFVARVNRARKKKGLGPCRYMAVLEAGNRSGRAHHHVLIDGGLSREEIEGIWGKGYANAKRIDLSNNGLVPLAKYMLKNALQTKDARGKHKKAWRTSRSVVRPETREEKMKRVPVFDIEDLKPRKGYGIDRDSIRLYEHAITGAYCIEYIEVSLEEEPKLKRYSKGKITSEERWYPESWDEQLSFDMVGGIV